MSIPVALTARPSTAPSLTPPSATPLSNVPAAPASSSASPTDNLIQLVLDSGAHPLVHTATKAGVFDAIQVKPNRVEKTFLNSQLKIEPWQPFCIWSPAQTGNSLSSGSSKKADFFISVGQSDGRLFTSPINREQQHVSTPLQPAMANASVRISSETMLRSDHRVLSVTSAPSHPLIAAVCDNCLFIMSTDISRFGAGPTVIARAVKKCRHAIAFDDQYLYYLIDGKDKIKCIPLWQLLEKTALSMPESRPFDVDSIVISLPCAFKGIVTTLSQFDITALSASCCILAIAHTKGFVVVDLMNKRSSDSNVIHRADHDGASRSMITMMSGGIVAVANHPIRHSVDDSKRVKRDDDKFFEDSVVFLQPPRSNVVIDSPDDLLRNHQIICARYSGTGCTIKGLTAVGQFMFVLLALKDGSANVGHGCFLDICVPTCGLSLNYYRAHRFTNCAKRLQQLTSIMPCFQRFNLKWIAPAGSSLACINSFASTDITLLDPNPAFFQNILDAHWFHEAKNQALPSLNSLNGTCEWDQLDILEPHLKDHWWNSLCFEIRRPHKHELQRLQHLSATFSQCDSAYSKSCFRTVTRNVWELVLRETESDETRSQRLSTIVPSSVAISPDASATPSPAPFNPWSELVSECAKLTMKPLDEKKSDFEKLGISFGMSSPSLKPGCIKPASDEDRMRKARGIMTEGMTKKGEKMSLAMADLASGPCARFFQMHICLRKISLSRTIGVDMLPITMSCCLYSPNGTRMTPNYEVDRRSNDPSPFDGTCVFANICGSDTKNRQPPPFVILAFRFYCHFRGDRRTPGKAYLEKEAIAEINVEKKSIIDELSNLGHMLQPLAWSFIILPVGSKDLNAFVWPSWVNQEESNLFLRQFANPKVVQHSEGQSLEWNFDTERVFSAPVYRLNNKAFTDEDMKNLVLNVLPRRERLTSSIVLSCTAWKGLLSLPFMSPHARQPAIIRALPIEHRRLPPANSLPLILSNLVIDHLENPSTLILSLSVLHRGSIRFILKVFSKMFEFLTLQARFVCFVLNTPPSRFTRLQYLATDRVLTKCMIFFCFQRLKFCLSCIYFSSMNAKKLSHHNSHSLVSVFVIIWLEEIAQFAVGNYGTSSRELHEPLQNILI
jgi:hypothetical protein